MLITGTNRLLRSTVYSYYSKNNRMSTSLKPASDPESAIPGANFCLRTFLAVRQLDASWVEMQWRQERAERQKVGRKAQCVTKDMMWFHTNVSVFFYWNCGAEFKETGCLRCGFGLLKSVNGALFSVN